jgi:hypothetical protein
MRHDMATTSRRDGSADQALADLGYRGRPRHAIRECSSARPLGEAEGAFLLCGFLLAAWAPQGDLVRATRWFERNRTACGPPGLICEEYDATQRQPARQSPPGIRACGAASVRDGPPRDLSHEFYLWDARDSEPCDRSEGAHSGGRNRAFRPERSRPVWESNDQTHPQTPTVEAEMAWALADSSPPIGHVDSYGVTRSDTGSRADVIGRTLAFDLCQTSNDRSIGGSRPVGQPWTPNPLAGCVSAARAALAAGDQVAGDSAKDTRGGVRGPSAPENVGRMTNSVDLPVWCAIKPTLGSWRTAATRTIGRKGRGPALRLSTLRSSAERSGGRTTPQLGAIMRRPCGGSRRFVPSARTSRTNTRESTRTGYMR